MILKSPLKKKIKFEAKSNQNKIKKIKKRKRKKKISFWMKITLRFLLICTFIHLLNARNTTSNNTANVTCIVESSSEVKCEDKIYTLDQKDPPGSGLFFVDLFISTICVLFAGKLIPFLFNYP